MFRAALPLSWRSSVASAISGIAPPLPLEFRCAHCRQGMNPSPKTHCLHRIFCSKPPIETPPPPLDRFSHTRLSRTKIAAIQRRTCRLKILPAVTPRHMPTRAKHLPLPRVTTSAQLHVSPNAQSAPRHLHVSSLTVDLLGVDRWLFALTFQGWPLTFL